MKLLKHKLPGFTIAELCIAMILSGILVSMAYLAYSNINQQYLRFSSTSNQISESYRCIGIMEDQFWKADSAYCSADTLILFSKDVILSRFYPASGKYLFSRQGMVDTFQIKLQAITPVFRDPSMVYGRIQSCQCAFMIEREELILQFNAK